ncbi:MAG: DUF1778 domain-containing protein [Myxococcota bacterium]|nr:DUF1778 domain-containing protein [Myxococcota bacterium]
MPSSDAQHSSNPPKKARLELRVSVEDKSLIQRAAFVAGLSQTDFILSCVKAHATKTLHAHEVMRLSEQDRNIFIDTFISPPEPNARLRKAAKRYLKRTSA